MSLSLMFMHLQMGHIRCHLLLRFKHQQYNAQGMPQLRRLDTLSL